MTPTCLVLHTRAYSNTPFFGDLPSTAGICGTWLRLHGQGYVVDLAET